MRYGESSARSPSLNALLLWLPLAAARRADEECPTYVNWTCLLRTSSSICDNPLQVPLRVRASCVAQYGSRMPSALDSLNTLVIKGETLQDTLQKKQDNLNYLVNVMQA